MHDLGLGGPVVVGIEEGAKHRGPCYDGVYGCHRCWDATNDGRGTLATCEWCKAADVYTKITRASDEPVLYAVCESCRGRQLDALLEEERRTAPDWEPDYEDD